MITLNQRRTIELLLDLYEKGKGYTEGEALKKKSVSPDKIMPEYYSHFTDLTQIETFEAEMKELEDKGLIAINKKQNGEIREIIAQARWDDMYALVGKTPKKAIIEELTDRYNSFNKENPVIQGICNEKLSILSKNKIPNEKKYREDYEETRILIELIERIMSNQTPLFERELSIELLHSSKKFTNYRSKVCNRILKYINMENVIFGLSPDKDKTEIEHIILEEYNIFANPAYIYFKGNMNIRFNNDSMIKLNKGTSSAILAEDIDKITDIEIYDDNIVTIENLTSYNRFSKENFSCIYLSGYHNTGKKRLIKKISEKVKKKSWYHFGDIDPDGFYIIEHLKKSTGIDFIPYKMGITELQKFREYSRQLEENDIIKAQNLISEGKYKEIMQYILMHNTKLEQECIH